MVTEIEHEYLIKQDLWKLIVPDKNVDLKYVYLITNPNKTIRVGTISSKG